jgi:anti-sigma B factor antagonist
VTGGGLGASAAAGPSGPVITLSGETGLTTPARLRALICRQLPAGTEIDISTAPRLRDLLIDLVSQDNYQLAVNMDKVEFLDSTGLGVLVGGLRRVRAHDGALDLVCTREPILKIFRITGLTKVFDIHETVDQAIAAMKRRQGS